MDTNVRNEDRVSFSWVCRTSIVKMALIPKMIYYISTDIDIDTDIGISLIPIEVLEAFFTELEEQS